MDSIEYSVMLELKTNSQAINKEVEKTLSIVSDYDKQFQSSYSNSIRQAERINSLHQGTNKVLSEQSSIWGKISFQIGQTFSKLSKLISATAISTTKAISDIIDDAAKAYDKLTENWRLASFQGAGGVSLLKDEAISLQATLGATREESEKVINSMVEVGFNAKKMGSDFTDLGRNLHKYQRITGVSSETTAKFAKIMMGLGLPYKAVAKANADLVVAMKQGILTTTDMNQISMFLADSMYSLSFAYGIEEIGKFTESMGALAVAAKRAGIDISKAGSLMRDLVESPDKFIVALGSDAFFNTPAENLEKLTNKVDEMKATMSSFPPGMANQMLKQLYGIDSATLKLLESNKKIKEEQASWPDNIKEFNKTYEESSKSLERQLTELKNKLGAIFEGLGKSWMMLKQKVFGKIFEGVPEALQKLQTAFLTLYNTIFDVAGANDDINNALSKVNEWLISIIDKTTAWVQELSKPENLKIIKGYVNDIYEFFKKIVNVLKDDIIPWIVEASKTILKIAGVMYDIAGTIYNIGAYILGPLWSALKFVAGTIYDISAFVLGTLWDAFKFIAGTTYDIGAYILGTLWDALKWIGKTVYDIGEGFVKAGKIVIWFSGKLLGAVLDAVYEIGEFVLGTLWGAFKSVAGTIYDIGAYILGPLWGAYKSIAETIFGPLWNALKSVAVTIYVVGTYVLGTLWGAFKSVAGTIYDIDAYILGTLWNGLKKIVKYVGDKLNDAWEKVSKAAGKVKDDAIWLAETVTGITMARWVAEWWSVEEATRKAKEHNRTLVAQLEEIQKKQKTGIWSTKESIKTDVDDQIVGYKSKEDALKFIKNAAVTYKGIYEEHEKNFERSVKQEMELGGLSEDTARRKIKGMIKENKLKYKYHQELLKDTNKLDTIMAAKQEKDAAKEAGKTGKTELSTEDKIRKQNNENIKKNTEATIKSKDAIDKNTNELKKDELEKYSSGYEYSRTYGEAKDLIGRSYKDESGEGIMTLNKIFEDQAKKIAKYTDQSYEAALKKRKEVFIASAKMEYDDKIAKLQKDGKTKEQAEAIAMKQLRNSKLYKNMASEEQEKYFKQIADKNSQLLPAIDKAVEIKANKMFKEEENKSTNAQEIPVGSGAGSKADMANVKSITINKSEIEKEAAEDAKASRKNLDELLALAKAKADKESKLIFRNNPSKPVVDSTLY
jgi:hypothetical protein